MLSIQKILSLAETHNPTCVSMYMPTSKKGMNVLNSKDQLEFKTMIRQIEKEISGRFKYKREVHDFLVPLQEMVVDKEFWRNQAEGLAVFYSNKGLHRFHLPIPIKKRHVISNNFLLWPLIEAIPTEEQSFYLLALGLDKVHLYLANPFGMKKVLKNKLSQVSFEETVGSDFEEKQLQFHSQKSGFATAIYHGRGEGKDDLKDEILKYFRSINEIVVQKLKDNKVPLLLTGLDHLVGLYKMVNKYPFVIDQHLTGNHEDREPEELHEDACRLMQPIFDQVISEKVETINQYLDTEKTGTDITDILPNAMAGKVDSLILNANAEIWGIYHPEKGKLRLDPEPSISNVSLMNLAAIKTLDQGGRVFISQGQHLPSKETKLCALYRY